MSGVLVLPKPVCEPPVFSLYTGNICAGRAAAGDGRERGATRPTRLPTPHALTSCRTACRFVPKVMQYVKSLLPEGDMTLAQILACADIAMKLLDTDEATNMPSDMRDELLRLIAQCVEVKTLTPAAQDLGSRLRFLVVSFVMLHDDPNA